MLKRDIQGKFALKETPALFRVPCSLSQLDNLFCTTTYTNKFYTNKHSLPVQALFV